MRVIIAYDISDNDNRARVAALLGRVGIRVQKSVFDCEVEPVELTELLNRVEQTINVDQDTLDVFGSCQGCEERRWHVGQSRAAVMDALWWVV